MSRAQRIVDSILGSERFAQTEAFSEMLFRDEPILRTGAQAFARDENRLNSHGWRRLNKAPAEYQKMHELAGLRRRTYGAWSDASRIFYEQAKYMEDFSDSFDGECDYADYFPTYENMTLYQQRCYFSWRTKLRAGQVRYAPTSFLFVHAYELLCGVGTEPGKQGYEDLTQFYEQYKGISPSFDRLLVSWIDDYVIYHGLDPRLLVEESGSVFADAITTMYRAQKALLSTSGDLSWPNKPPTGMPSAEELLDAIAVVARYGVNRSRYVKRHRADVAWVTAHVFARMVAHCHKRRRTDYVEGLFGEPRHIPRTMFASAIFWSPEQHEDCVYEVSPSLRYECINDCWFEWIPCRWFVANKELGVLMHTIDARMRVRTDDSHPLKPRTIPKYQSKFVDEAIDALLISREQEEKRRVRIDWSSLGGIRKASDRTREALLTDDERDDEAVSDPMIAGAPVVEAAAGDAPEIERIEEGKNCASACVELGLTAEQLGLLRALLAGEAVSSDGFLSLAVDAINEAFLDIVGDTVIEFDDETPVLVEDYLEDVREFVER